jgi:hypothetical protein
MKTASGTANLKGERKAFIRKIYLKEVHKGNANHTPDTSLQVSGAGTHGGALTGDITKSQYLTLK